MTRVWVFVNFLLLGIRKYMKGSGENESLTVAKDLFQLALDHKELRDEYYLQLMKQTTR